MTQAVFGRETGERALPPAEQALLGANPQRAVGIFHQGSAVIADHGRRIGKIEVFEAHSIESAQPKAGGYP